MRCFIFEALGLMICLAICISCAQKQNLPIYPSHELPSNPASDDSGQKHLWGLWEVEFNPEAESIEIIPIRIADFTCNVTKFLQPPAGKISNLKIVIKDQSKFITEGLLDVVVTLTHPFPGLPFYTGFDVIGVFINHGDTLSKYDTSVNYALGHDTARLLNADGLTRWYNPTEFTAQGIFGYTEGALGTKGILFSGIINGYKYFADELGADDEISEYFHNPSNIEKRGMFSSGSSNSRLYKLRFPIQSGSPILTFQYAVIASWEPPAFNPPQNIPGDFPPSANAREPVYLSIKDNGSTLYYTSGGGGGTLKISAELFDWGAATNINGILGEFSKIVIESPSAEIPGGYAEFTPADFVPFIQPSTAISSVADIEFDGVVPTSGEDVIFLITVVAKENETYEQGFNVPIPTAPLANYFIFSVPVGDNPCGNFNVTGTVPSSVKSGLEYPDFKVLGENFINGPNLSVAIMDGSTVLLEGKSVAFVSSSTIQCSFNLCGIKPGGYMLKVTNGCEPISTKSISFTIEPDPLKNIVLRGGVKPADLGICAASGEPYVQFVDGQLWVYNKDYSAGAHQITSPPINSAINRVAVQNPASDQTYGEATMCIKEVPSQFIFERDKMSQWGGISSGTGFMLDVFAIYNNTRHYYVRYSPTPNPTLSCTRRTISGIHGGNTTSYSQIGAGPGLVNVEAVVGMDWVGPLPVNLGGWMYFLEANPDYSVERINYNDQSPPGTHALTHNKTFFGTKGDADDQLNDPRDIAADLNYRIFILDKYSNGQPVVKIYNSDLQLLGKVGDSISISGDPLRIDIDDGDGEIHVAHTNGVSVFRPCEIPL